MLHCTIAKGHCILARQDSNPTYLAQMLLIEGSTNNGNHSQEVG